MKDGTIVKPNLLVIGVQKGGTTWLHCCLASHPGVFMSKTKELHFFQKTADEVREGFGEYCANFEEGRNCRYRGETTPVYFWTPPDDPRSGVRYQPANRRMPQTVREYLGADVWLLLGLRCPVERAISGFFHNFRGGRLDPRKTIFEEGHRFGILDRGHYKRHFAKWCSVFDQGRFVITLYDDIKADPAAAAKQLYDRLNLSPILYDQANTVHNPGLERGIVNGALTISHASSSKVNRRFFDGKLRADPGAGAVSVSQRDVDRLAELYAEDIDFVKHLLGRRDLRWGRRPLAEFAAELD